MNRLHRRIAILRGKRQSAFDAGQYWTDGAWRTRDARQVRVQLRAGRAVVLITPRWSRPQQFLEDLALDLSLGDPAITARTLNLLPLRGLTPTQAWAWITQAVTEFTHQSLPEGAAWQAVNRHGFRTVIGDLFARAEEDGTRRALLLHGLEAVAVEALRDLVDVFGEHMARFGGQRKFNLLFAGSHEATIGGLEGAVRVELRDFAPKEAVEVLVEHLGPLEPHRLASVVGVIGGVPALLDALGMGGAGSLSELIADRETLWRALGPVAEELRAALDIVNADSQLSHRLERLARLGPLPAEPDRDDALLRAGLVRQQRRAGSTHTEVRAPWFSDLVMAH